MLCRSSRNESFKLVEIIRYVGMLFDKTVSVYAANNVLEELNFIKKAWEDFHIDAETRKVVVGVVDYLNRKKNDGTYIVKKVDINDIAFAIDLYKSNEKKALKKAI